MDYRVRRGRFLGALGLTIAVNQAPGGIPDPPPDLRDVWVGMATYSLAASLSDKAQRDTMQETAAQVVRNGAQKLTEFS